MCYILNIPFYKIWSVDETNAQTNVNEYGQVSYRIVTNANLLDYVYI